MMFRKWGGLLLSAGLVALSTTAKADSIQIVPYSGISIGMSTAKNLYTGVGAIQVFSLPNGGDLSHFGYGGTVTADATLNEQEFDGQYTFSLAKSVDAELGAGGNIYFTPQENLTYTISGNVSLSDTTTASKPSIYMDVELQNEDTYQTLYSLDDFVTQNNFSYTLSNNGAIGSLTGTLLAGVEYNWDFFVSTTNANKNPIAENGTAEFTITFAPATSTPLPKTATAGTALLAACGATSVLRRRPMRG